MEVPYFTRAGEHYRTKLFPWSGEPRARWLGASKPQLPFGLHRLPAGGDVVIVTEGESDTMALAVAFPKVPVIGLPGASSWQSEWRVYLEDFRRVYLSFDADPAGLELTDCLRRDLDDYRLIDLPRGADTRAFLQTLGRNAFKVLVEAADRGWEVRQVTADLERALWRRRAVEEAWAKR